MFNFSKKIAQDLDFMFLSAVLIEGIRISTKNKINKSPIYLFLGTPRWQKPIITFLMMF